MKLKGSHTETRFAEELEHLQQYFLDHPRFDDIRCKLAEIAGEEASVLAYDCFPVDGDECFTFLVAGQQLVQLEIPPTCTDAIVVAEIEPLGGFKRGLKQIGQIKLAVALNMASKMAMANH